METNRVWPLVRFIKKNERSLIIPKYKGKLQRSDGIPVSDEFQEVGAIILQDEESYMSRSSIALRFATRKLNSSQEDSLLKISVPVNKEKLAEIVQDANFRIDSCIPKFLSKKLGDDDKICLTREGKDFATVRGLLKEWVVVDIGWIASGIGLFALLRWDWIIAAAKAIKNLFLHYGK